MFLLSKANYCTRLIKDLNNSKQLINNMIIKDKSPAHMALKASKASNKC